jgi:hypothetical protein
MACRRLVEAAERKRGAAGNVTAVLARIEDAAARRPLEPSARGAKASAPIGPAHSETSEPEPSRDVVVLHATPESEPTAGEMVRHAPLEPAEPERSVLGGPPREREDSTP